MKLTNISVLFVAFTSTMCIGEVLVSTTEVAESSELVEATVELLACYGKGENTIGVIGNIPETLLSSLWAKQNIGVILMNDATRSTHVVGEVWTWQEKTKLNVFVIVGCTMEEVRSGLVQFKNSPWINQLASFLVLDWSPLERYGCMDLIRQFRILEIARIYNANIVCLHRTLGETLIYTSNPHTPRAPRPWTVLTILRKRPHGFFSVYARGFHRGENNCENLIFDKTIDLGGQTIEFLHWPNVYTKYGRTLGEYEGYELAKIQHIWMTFIRQVNATSKKNEFFMSKERMPEHEGGSLKDVALTPLNYGVTINAGRTYPVGQAKHVIMTQYRGYKSQLRKILGVVDAYSQIGTCLVLVLTTVFFKVFAHQTVAQAVLNVIRVTCNMGFENLPQSTSSRIYIGCLLFFVVTMQGIFAGDLAALLTTKIPLRLPETIQDLAELGYTIHTWPTNMPYFTDPMFRRHIVEIPSSDECTSSVLRDPLAACVGDENFLKDEAARHNLYVSTDPVIKHYYGFTPAPNWPFRDRLNKILSIMHEADIRDPFPLRVHLKRLSERKLEQMNYNEPKVMTLQDLRFAFIILGIGLLLGFVTWVIEVAIGTR